MSQILILIIFRSDDRVDADEGGPSNEDTRGRFNVYITIHSIMTICMAAPALLLIREKPPSPPSMVATKSRPVQTFRQAFQGLITNANYIHIFVYFQCVNLVSIYNGEIDGFTVQYGYTLVPQTVGSILNCVAGIAGSLLLGKYLDKHRCFKKLQIINALGVSLTVLLTFLVLHFNGPTWITILITILGGIPISSISLVSYQFAAEVIYPVSEVQGVSMMNVVNKLLTFAHINLVEKITDDTPDHINYMYGFMLWIFFPLIGLIPAFFVEEDLRRLNMKEVEKSQYVEEKTLLLKDDAERKRFYRENKVIAGDDVLEMFFDIHYRYSVRETYKSEALTTEEYDLKKRNRRGSDNSIRKSQAYEPLIKTNPAASRRDSHYARVKARESSVDDENKSLKVAGKLARKKNEDDEDEDADF